MEFYGPIIRPGTDADSVFIEVTAGCTHNGCTFCNFYRDTPLFNHRRDAYGGSLENRFRFLDEVYQAIRQRVGADYPVWIKLNSSDEEPGGLSNDDFIWMGKQLVQQGMNAIEVNGNKWQMHPFKEHAYYFDVASRLQKEVKTDIILTGGLRNREDIEKATKAGISYFGFARPFIQNIDFLKTSEK